VYSSDLTLNCNLSGNISFYFTENNYTTKQIITYDSVKYSSLNTSVMIIKKLGKNIFNLKKKNNLSYTLKLYTQSKLIFKDFMHVHRIMKFNTLFQKVLLYLYIYN
jgi:hypothetical protein